MEFLGKMILNFFYLQFAIIFLQRNGMIDLVHLRLPKGYDRNLGGKVTYVYYVRTENVYK